MNMRNYPLIHTSK